MIDKKLLGPQTKKSVLDYFRKTGTYIKPSTAEDELFLWIEYGFNEYCIECVNMCKQHGACKIVQCPMFEKDTTRKSVNKTTTKTKKTKTGSK